MLQMTPRLVDATILESKNVKRVSCGARHSTVMTGSTRAGLGFVFVFEISDCLGTFLCYKILKSSTILPYLIQVIEKEENYYVKEWAVMLIFVLLKTCRRCQSIFLGMEQVWSGM